jgi:Capsule biosynthesis CapC
MILPIFPEGGLASSVITTVWVGVFVLAFFNLRFGWVLSGLVVPGYLVPLLILRPVAAGVIVFEAVLTYAIVWFFSEKLSRGRYPALFGRDRFMGLVLASIAVRVTMDGWLLPIAADWISAQLGRQVDWQSNLQSFGLIVISLMANQFWKPGLVRGLISAAVVIGITFLIVRFGLMEFTNFRLSGVSYIYEGLASSILASPKAYMILVITAMLASHMNLRFGWDFSGILIPALIALQWYQPTKILTSFVEAAVIYALAQGVLRLPWLAGVTMEGARKLVLFFNVSFAYKLVLGHALAWLALDVKTTDFYGFGYLLSTLLAIKAYEKNIFARVMRSTFEVSLAGAVLGNLVGFVLAWMLPSAALSQDRQVPGSPGPARLRDQLVVSAIGDAHARRLGGLGAAMSQTQLAELETALDLLAAGSDPQFIAPGLAQSGLTLSRAADGTVMIARNAGMGRDLIVFNPKARRDLAVVVPDSASAPGLGLAALTLFEAQGARWLVLAAPPSERLAFAETLLGRFRSATAAPELVVAHTKAAKPALWLSDSGAVAIDLGQVREALPGLAARFRAAPLAESPGASSLILDFGAIAAIARSAPAPETKSPTACSVPATQGKANPQAATARLAFVRFEIVEPLQAAMQTSGSDISVATRAARLAGLSLDQCTLAGRRLWRLGSPGGGEGTFFFDPLGARLRAVQSSSERARLRDTAFDVAINHNAGTLLFAPSEAGLVESQRSVFGVVSQASMRAMGPSPGELLQLRPAPSQRPAQAGNPDLLVVTDVLERNAPQADTLLALARRSGFRPALINRSRPTAGYEIVPNTSLRYLNMSANKRYATFWVIAAPTNGSKPAGPAND